MSTVNSYPLGLKWPDEPIEALGVYYSYDEKLLRGENFIENLDKKKKTYEYLVVQTPIFVRKGHNNQSSRYSQNGLFILTNTNPRSRSYRIKSNSL